MLCFLFDSVTIMSSYPVVCSVCQHQILPIFNLFCWREEHAYHLYRLAKVLVTLILTSAKYKHETFGFLHDFLSAVGSG